MQRDRRTVRPQTPCRILVHGHLGRGNAGDEAMLQVIIRQLHELISDSTFVIAYGSDTQPPTDLPGSTAHVPRTFKSILRELRTSDLFVIAGGTHLTCFGKNKRAKLGGILRQMIPVMIARLLGVKVLMLSVGVGPFNSALAKWLVRLTLNHVHFISVRDSASEAQLEALRYAGPKTRCPDAAFFLDYPAPPSEPIQPCLGVSVMPYYLTHMRDGESDEQLVNAFAEAIRAWLDYFPEGRVVLVPVCAQQGAVSDTTMTEPLIRRFANDDRVSAYPYRGNPDELLNLLGSVTQFVGMRYHSVLLACMAGVSTLNVAYHEKGRVLAHELELPDAAVLTVEDVCGGDLARIMPQFCREPARFMAKRRKPALPIESLLPRDVLNQLVSAHERSGNHTR